MQKAIRVNESQILHLSARARNGACTQAGFLHKRSLDTGRWQLRYFILYQNLLFYFDSDRSERPSCVALLEGSYCDKYLSVKHPDKPEKQQCAHCFSIFYKKDGQRHFDLRAESEADCDTWVEAIRNASYSKLQESKEGLEQKHLHLLQILDTERQSKWNYVQQTEELSAEVSKLRIEVRELKDARRDRSMTREHAEENSELRKIKKVQSFFRGWLCRRRWKQIVEEYIRSEHAEHMRRRNAIVFGLVECEEEYVRQICILVTCFLRPCKMAASAKKPIISHEDVNSIFLNAETVLFLHQIFLQGLNSKMDNWPTLQLGDLFDMLLPMLGIYQEYVRNHHYSLQVLAEYKQKPEFAALLKRYEEKSMCEGRSLETFLTYPMHQIPRYIVTLHELLAHTPHDHVDRQQLEFAKGKLEDLSHVMHDEVSETESIRKNLAIERMIVEGCDILLDANQMFVRQGALTQIAAGEKAKNARARLGSFSSTFNSFNKDSKKDPVRQVFLFTNHLILTTRASSGRLHLVKNHGKISLADCSLTEDNSSDFFYLEDDEMTHQQQQQQQQQQGLLSVEQPQKEARADFNGLDFRIILDTKSGPPVTLTLVANSIQEKSAWCSDINQCIEQIHYSDLLNSTLAETSSVSMPHTISSLACRSKIASKKVVMSDPKLFKDDIDIKFSRTLNSCKVPQIRHASVERLLDRLTDLRFLSIDFLNTFLLTYRIFTDPKTVIAALQRVLTNPEFGNLDPKPGTGSQLVGDTDANCSSGSGGDCGGRSGGAGSSGSSSFLHTKPQLDKSRRISTGMMHMESCCEGTAGHLQGPHRTGSLDAGACERLASQRPTFQPSDAFCRSADADADPPDILRELSELTERRKMAVPTASATSSDLAPIASFEIITEESRSSLEEEEDQRDRREKLIAKKVRIAGVTESEVHDSGPPLLSTDRSPVTLTTSRPILVGAPASPKPRNRAEAGPFGSESQLQEQHFVSPARRPQQHQQQGLASPGPSRRATSPTVGIRVDAASAICHSTSSLTCHSTSSPVGNRPSSPMCHSASSPSVNQQTPNLHTQSSWPRSSVASNTGPKRPSCAESHSDYGGASRSSIARSELDSPPCRTRAGAVVTSSRASKRRFSNTAAALAFAVATAGAANSPKLTEKLSKLQPRLSDAGQMDKRLSIICTAATMRVLNVVRHWVYKFGEDIQTDPQLRSDMTNLLEDLVCNQSLFPPDHKAALQILLRLRDDSLTEVRPDLDRLLTPPTAPSCENFDTLSALGIAEQITFIDYQIFRAVRSTELLTQAWMKKTKNGQKSTVNLVSQRFNEVSRLVISEIVSRSDVGDRVACIEKWAAIADICRCLHNYNGVLQICAAFVNSSVFRLKKTWEKLTKSTRQLIDKLQQLVSSDCRFKNMRSALHTGDTPCIPYLGMYLTDLSFIEEGTSNVTDGGLINFCKMRMIAHVIREIQQFQQTPYKIEHNQKVCAYLLDNSRQMDDEQAYQASLRLEPRLSICPDAAQQTRIRQQQQQPQQQQQQQQQQQ